MDQQSEQFVREVHLLKQETQRLVLSASSDDCKINERQILATDIDLPETSLPPLVFDFSMTAKGHKQQRTMSTNIPNETMFAVKDNAEPTLLELSDFGSAASAVSSLDAVSTLDGRDEKLVAEESMETPMPDERIANQTVQLREIKEQLDKTEREKAALEVLLKTLQSKNTELNRKVVQNNKSWFERWCF